MEPLVGIQPFLVPLALIVLGFLAGVILEKVILTQLRNFFARTKWEEGQIVTSSLRGMAFLWSAIAGFYAAALSLSLSPQISEIVQKSALVIILLSATVVTARIAVGLVRTYSQKIEEVLPATSLFTNLTSILVYLIGILIIMQSLGISITPILTALGVGGLAVALALQDILTNLFAGIHIILSRKVGKGDYIKLDSGEEGYVTDISWRNTSIRALPNNMFVVPNARLASAIVVNYYQPEKEMAVLVDVGVGYDSDLEKVERVTIGVAKEVMREVPGGVSEFEPFIRYHTLGDFSINFTVILRAREYVDQYLIKHEFVKRLHVRYQKEDIVIPFPTRIVYRREDSG